MKEWTIKKGALRDLDELERLYDALCDVLEKGVNHPGWKKGVYPTRATALEGIEEGTLFLALADGVIAGTVILRHTPEEGYARVNWGVELADEEALVVYTLAVHPDCLGLGVGRRLMEFALDHAATQGARVVRLDVYEKNMPAICLYEACGFAHVATADLGYAQYGLDRYRLYQKLL